MLRINEHGIEPGVYKDDHGFAVVVLDIINHGWNAEKGLQEFLSEPLVIGRDLATNEGKRYMWPLEVFKLKFTKQ